LTDEVQRERRFPRGPALARDGREEVPPHEQRRGRGDDDDARAVFVYREAVVQREVDPQRADRLRERELAVVPSASIAQWDAPRGDAVERARAELHRDAEDEADPSMARAEEGGRPR